MQTDHEELARRIKYETLKAAAHKVKAHPMRFAGMTEDYIRKGLAEAVMGLQEKPLPPDYEPAWRELHEKLSWMQGNPKLDAYLGMNFADVANDLIDRAYPGLRDAGN